MDFNVLSGEIINAAMKVHTILGPGLLESAYETCLRHELSCRGHEVKCQIQLPIIYEGIKIDAGYRLDLLVENSVIVELKAQERLLPIHEAQLLSYLKLSGKKIGLLINFKEIHLRNGIRRIVNNFLE